MACHFHILVPVIPRPVQILFLVPQKLRPIFEFNLLRARQTAVMLLTALLALPAWAAAPTPVAAQSEAFGRAWQAAARGDRALFEQLKPGLQGYLLYPYLQYEDLRHRRRQVDPAEMARFLEQHADWAFTEGLRRAWLRTLGQERQWDALILHAQESDDAEVRCHLANARLQRGQTDGLLAEARALWTVGESQHDACDPVFRWLNKQGGITSGLAWERIKLAMEARQPGLAQYLSRFVDAPERFWVDRWQKQDRSGYRRLDQAAKWNDHEKARDITDYGLRRLSRNDADRAWEIFLQLDGQIAWPEATRGRILQELALWSAVDGSPATGARMLAVPADFRDDRLLEWWARHDLASGNWDAVLDTIGQMSDELRFDSRWKYWAARARQEAGETEQARVQFGELALESNYYGFLAADAMDMPYTICQQEPEVEPGAVDRLAAEPGFDRALELRRAEIRNWSRSEWKLAARELDRQGLRTAAALATRENWPDMAIFALGDSGDLRWYEWRFPLEYSALAESKARSNQIDPSWVMGLMRSESAMAQDAMSSAGAMGLMQVMPQTARQLAKRHTLAYSGKQQLLQPDINVNFGTVFLRELLDRYNENQVLASGAYNAGPHVVDRWMRDRTVSDPAIWIDTLPYYETRDYIPRVLAFTTIYAWRLQQPVQRLSARMPALDSVSNGGTMKPGDTTEVVCKTSARS
jgi:soluble lytic murein transglycosylase